jgi:DNA-binding CsgD family transcriptional regulator
VPLTDRGHVLGSLTLVRPDAHPFGDDDVTRAGALAAPLAQAFRQFVAGDVLRPPVRASAPGVVMLGSDHAILGITQTARDSLRVLWPNDPQVDDRKLVGVLWNSVYLARQTGRRAVSRIPTPDGWLAVHAEPFESADPGAVAVTVEPALGEELLPVLAAWYRVTPAELGVVRQATGGLAAKQIARKLDLSLHTVNDHLRSVYRKTGAAGRDELLARLGPA